METLETMTFSSTGNILDYQVTSSSMPRLNGATVKVMDLSSLFCLSTSIISTGCPLVKSVKSYYS